MISNYQVSPINTWPYYEVQTAIFTGISYQDQLFARDENDLNSIIQKYCLCDACFPTLTVNPYCNHTDCMPTANTKEAQLNEYALSIAPSLNSSFTPNQYHKRRFLDTIDFQQNIAALLSTIKRVTNENKMVVHGKRKSIARVRMSNRRSHYTGVFKNGDNWQALISIQKRKTYIGTYTNELEAAKVFDFYSILLNNITATANFDYTKKDIIEMIENFVSNDGKYA